MTGFGSSQTVANTQKLREVIGSLNSNLGSTEAGKAWCIKALHPSDPLTEVVGIPDMSTASSVFLNMQQQVVLDSVGAGAWDVDMTVLSDPTTFLSIDRIDSAATHTQECVHNSQFGATVSDATGAWFTAFERWRCAYMGVSIYLNASDMYNEGAVAAAQYPLVPRVITNTSTGGPALAGVAGNAVAAQLVVYSASDDPQYSDLIKMPNAYTGEARDGVYLPLKLDSNHAKWHDENDWSISLAGTGVVGASSQRVFPYYGVGSAQVRADPSGVGEITGESHLLSCTGNAGRVSFRGLNHNAKITVVIRAGFEAQTQPGSAYTSFQKLCCEHDLAAEIAYFQIARQLKDAYPVEYNDLGKLWDVIRGVAKAANPFVRAIPIYGPMISSAGKMLGGVVDRAVARREAPRAPADALPAATLERVSKAVSQTLASPQRRVSVAKARKAIAKRKPVARRR